MRENGLSGVPSALEDSRTLKRLFEQLPIRSEIYAALGAVDEEIEIVEETVR